MKFCSNCGQENEKGLNFCANCGANLTGVVKSKKKGNGKAVASMVLGIIAVVWAFMSLLSFGNIEPNLLNLLDETELTEVAAKISFAIGFNILSLPCGIIGLILGCRAKKNGKAVAGIITSSIALLIAIIACIIIFTV